MNGTAPSVCVLVHAHPDFSKGGGETAAYRQFTTLREEGWRTWYVAAADLGRAPADSGQAAIVAPYAPDEYLFAHAGMAEDRLFWEDAGARRALVEFLAGLGADVYHFHHYWRLGADLIADLAEARPDARLVITLHEMLAICAHHGQMVRTQGRDLCHRASPIRCAACYPVRAPEHFVLRHGYLLAALRRFHAAICPSAFIRDRYRDWGLCPDVMPVLDNYLGSRLMSAPPGPADLPAPLNAPPGSFGFFGQPTEFKGLDILLRGFALALRGAPALTLAVFGCGRPEVVRMFPELDTVLEALGPSVTLFGRYDGEEVLELMRMVGWVVVPSIWWENSPVVIQEARRAGVPLLVSDIGGMAEKVAPGVDGLHFKRGSPVDLARAMRQAAVPETRARLGASIREVIGKAEFLAGMRQAYGFGEAGPVSPLSCAASSRIVMHDHGDDDRKV